MGSMIDRPFWVRAGLSLATVAVLGCSADRGPANPTSVPVPVSTATVSAESTRLAKLFESYAPKIDGPVVRGGLSFDYRLVTLSNLTRSYALQFNADGLAYWLNYCGISNFGNYRMTIQAVDVLSDNPGNRISETHSNDFSLISISPLQYAQDVNQFFMQTFGPGRPEIRSLLVANSEAAGYMCGIGESTRLLRAGVTDKNVLTEAAEKANQQARNYPQDFLEDKRPLILRPVLTNPT